MSPTHPRQTRDRIARRAAELLSQGRAAEIHHAIQRAAAEVEAGARCALPSPALVRRHAQGMAQQALGAEGYEALTRLRLARALEVMHALDEQLGARSLLCGRAARGLLDADPTFHIRAYTRSPVGHIARCLLGAGLPEPSIQTLETRHGRANQIVSQAPEGTFAVLRCLPEWRRNASQDLFTGRAIATQDAEQLGRQLDGEAARGTEG